MNRLRSGGQARISFFSFQDIITSVTGILILVTLMLSFSMQTGEPRAGEDQARQVQIARERLAQLESENQSLQQRRIEAASLPDSAQLQAQIEILQRDLTESQQRLDQTVTTLASARERLAQQDSERDSAEKIHRELATLESKLAELREKAAHARTNVNVIYVIPDPAARRNPKAPLVIVVNNDAVRAQRLDGSNSIEAPIASVDSLQPILARHNPERDLIVFYFRPSGVKWFEAFRNAARKGGFEIGYDAVEEQKEIVFAVP